MRRPGIPTIDTTQLQQLFTELELPSFTEPIPLGTIFETDVEGVKIEELGPKVNEWTRIKYIEDYKMYLKNQERHTTTLVALYNVTWGQCLKKLQDCMKAEETYKAIETEMNVAELLKLVKAVSI